MTTINDVTGAATGESSLAAEGDFKSNRYIIARGFLSTEIGRLLFDYVSLKRRAGLLQGPDSRIPDAPRLYGDPLSETLLLQKQQQVEDLTETSLWPSYSYARWHGEGASMPEHLDREASEIGVTIHVGGDRLWPLWFRIHGEPRSVLLDVGDAIVYSGRELPHWRERFDGEHQVQCMLFYVRKDGECAAHRYDGRIGLGVPQNMRRAER